MALILRKFPKYAIQFKLCMFTSETSVIDPGLIIYAFNLRLVTQSDFCLYTSETRYASKGCT